MKSSAIIALGALAGALVTVPAEAKTVGFYMADNRIPNVSGTKEALKAAGWEIVDIKNKAIYTNDAELQKFGARPIKRVFYPNTKTDVSLAGRSVTLRDFSAYDQLVIEF